MTLLSPSPPPTLAGADRVRDPEGAQGWYEVFYVTVAVGGGRSVWLRWTLLRPCAGEATCALWACAFDRERPRWFAARRSLPASAWSVRDAGGVRVGDAELNPSGCAGEVADASGRPMRWELSWRPIAEPAAYFPAAVERAAGAATFPIAAVPLARATGWIEVDGERIAVDGAPAQQSHLFGGRHANRWGWVHALGFEDDPDGFLTLIWARPQRAGGHIPAVSALLLRVDGTVHRSTGMRAVRWSDLGGDGVLFRGRAGDARVAASVRAPVGMLTGVTYHDPDGSEVFCANTEVADLEATVTVGDQRRPVRCVTACGFERGSRTPMTGIWQPL
jgi:hypothetical protein